MDGSTVCLDMPRLMAEGQTCDDIRDVLGLPRDRSAIASSWKENEEDLFKNLIDSIKSRILQLIHRNEAVTDY